MNKITQEQIRNGYHSGVVQLIVDPNIESGTVCQIGEHWFYFGGMTAEEESPAEYQKNVPEDDILQEIMTVLDIFEKDEPDEYLYYYYILQETGC